MSLLFYKDNGTEEHIAGLNGVSGELVPSVSLYKKGTVTFSCEANSWNTVVVTFDTPMPDDDYQVILDSARTAYVHVQNVTYKTTAGFTVIIYNRDTLSGGEGIINWQAFKLMTDETTQLDEAQIALNKQDITTINAKIPSTASSSNQLVTAADNNFKYQVCVTDSDLNDIKLSGAYSIYISDPTSQATNHAPTYGWLQLSVIQMNNSQSFCNQVLYSADGKMFMRECGNGAWSDWKQIGNDLTSGTLTIPAQTLPNGEFAEIQIPLVPNDFYCGRIDFGNLPAQNMSLSYNDFSGTFQDTKATNQRTQDVLCPIGKANLGILHVYLTNYTGSSVAISDVSVRYYLEHHKAQ